MALPPTIPTSFVPRQPSGDSSRPRSSGRNYFLIASLGLLAVMVVASAALFAYEKYLTSVRNEKATALIAAQKNINSNTVQDFVRLKERLDGTRNILQKHIGLSQFFDFLEKDTLQTVHYDSLTITVADDRTAAVIMTGVAKTFNSLAAQSSTLAQESKIKRAIFSGFQIQKDNSVKFSLSFDIDKSLVALTGPVPVTTAGSAPAGGFAPATTTASLTNAVSTSTPLPSGLPRAPVVVGKPATSTATTTKP